MFNTLLSPAVMAGIGGAAPFMQDPYANPVDPLAPLPQADPNAVAAPPQQGLAAQAAQAAQAEPQKEAPRGFFRQPYASDALLAFGAGLLSGNNFFDGLAKGATGMAGVKKQYVELNKPKRTLIANGAFTLEEYPDGSQKIIKNDEVAKHLYETEDHKFGNRMTLEGMKQDSYMQRLDKTLNSQQALAQMRIDAERGSLEARLAYERARDDRDWAEKWDMMRYEVANRPDPYHDSLARQEGKNDADKLAIREQAKNDLKQLDRAFQIYGSGQAGSGPGFIQGLKRGAVDFTGKSMAGVNITDMHELRAIFNSLQLRQSAAMKGQGQITEFERKLIASTLPNPETDPAAAIKLLRELYAIAQKNANYTPSGPAPSGERAPPRGIRTSGKTNGVSWRIVK